MMFYVGWLVSILLSKIFLRYNRQVIFKDLANLNLKINMKKYESLIVEDINNSLEIENLISLIPLFNVIYQLYKRVDYVLEFNNTVKELDTLGILEKMTTYEIEYYDKFHSIKRALDLYIDPTAALVEKEEKEFKQQIKEQNKKEFVITYSFFDKDYNSISFITKNSRFKIVKSSGPISNMKIKEQKEVLEDLQDYVCRYFLKKYGNDEDALKKLKEITYDDIVEALDDSQFKIEHELVLKKDLRKRK